MYLEVPSAQPRAVGVALSADPGAPSAPVVDELLGERLVSYQAVPFVYKVRKTEAPEGRKLGAQMEEQGWKSELALFPLFLCPCIPFLSPPANPD